MRVCFFRSDKPREGLLADAFARGAIEHGDDVIVRRLTNETQIAADCEVAVMVGVKSKALFDANWGAGIHTVLLDKGYVRHSAPGPVRGWEYWRAAVDAHHPTRYLMAMNYPSDRLDRLGLEMKPWRESGEHVLIAGSSAKYHEFYGLENPTAYAKRLIKNLNRITGRHLIYRPKPTWREAVPIKGAAFSSGKEYPLDSILLGAHAAVTHGSNACFEAVLAGVPTIVLGDAVSKPISTTSLEEIEAPLMVSDERRRQWLANLAYHQFTLSEFASGEAWQHIRPHIYG